MPIGPWRMRAAVALAAGIAAWSAAIGRACAEDVPREATIVVGTVSGNPKVAFPKAEAMAHYLAEELADLGIRQGDAIVSNSASEAVDLLRRGAIDVISETVFSAVHFAEVGVGEILLHEWKRGVPAYRGMLIARHSSSIGALQDLAGRVVAFEHGSSTTGFLLPLARLREAGLKTIEVARGETPPPGTVGFVFATDEINIAAWVARDLADAGAISDQDWNDPGRTPEALRKELAAFYVSDPFPRSMILVRKDLDGRLKQAIRGILLRMPDEPGGAAVLKTYNGVARYEPITDQTARALDGVRALYATVKQDVH